MGDAVAPAFARVEAAVVAHRRQVGRRRRDELGAFAVREERLDAIGARDLGQGERGERLGEAGFVGRAGHEARQQRRPDRLQGRRGQRPAARPVRDRVEGDLVAQLRDRARRGSRAARARAPGARRRRRPSTRPASGPGARAWSTFPAGTTRRPGREARRQSRAATRRARISHRPRRARAAGFTGRRFHDEPVVGNSGADSVRAAGACRGRRAVAPRRGAEERQAAHLHAGRLHALRVPEAGRGRSRASTSIS